MLAGFLERKSDDLIYLPRGLLVVGKIDGTLLGHGKVREEAVNINVQATVSDVVVQPKWLSLV